MGLEFRVFIDNFLIMFQDVIVRRERKEEEERKRGKEKNGKSKGEKSEGGRKRVREGETGEEGREEETELKLGSC